MAALQIRADDGEALDALLWRTVGHRRGLVERVLSDNAGLAELGPSLPSGTAVTIADDAAVEPEIPLVQLWS